jgi:transposase
MPLLFESRRMSTMPKKIDEELRARAVRLVNDHLGEYQNMTAACAAVAKQVGVGKESVRRWVVQDQVDGGQRSGTTTGETAEVKKLKAENRRLREDNAILKAATVFFAGELDPRNR